VAFLGVEASRFMRLTIARCSLNRPMPVSDLDIRRLAHLFIQLDGEQATAKAREMVEEMRRKGDNEGADT
jgi:hypothetical protein